MNDDYGSIPNQLDRTHKNGIRRGCEAERRRIIEMLENYSGDMHVEDGAMYFAEKLRGGEEAEDAGDSPSS